MSNHYRNLKIVVSSLCLLLLSERCWALEENQEVSAQGGIDPKQAGQLSHQQDRGNLRKLFPGYNLGYYLDEMEAMQRKGVDFSSNLVIDIAGNPFGGEARGVNSSGSLGLFFNYDLERAFGIKNIDFYFTATYRRGDSLSENKIGNTFHVMQAYGSETLRLSNAALKITGLDQKLQWYIGRIGAGDIFLQSPYYSYFLNNGIDGNPVAIFYNLPFSAYPNSVWGSALDLKMRKIRVKIGVYNTNYNTFKSKYHGLNFTWKSPFGALLMTEVTYLVGQDSKDGYEGNYKIGTAYATGRQSKILGGEENGNVNYYLLCDQVFFKREFMRMGSFISLILADPSSNTFPLFMNGGVLIKGIFPNRHEDFTCLGFVYGKYSKDIRTKNIIEGQALQYSETDLELNHLFIINEHCSIQPSLQYIINPSGKKEIPNAFVIASQFSLSF